MKKLSSIVFLFLIIVACNKKESTTSSIRINISEIPQKEIKIQDITSDFSIIPLETSDRSLIQYIKKIAIHNDKILILDNQRPMFAVFDRNGKFIKNIGQIGNGPGEFYYPSDFIIDEKLKQIELLDGLRNRILIYDLEGNFIKRISLDIRGDYFAKFSDGSYIVYTNMRSSKELPFKLVRIDNNGRLISKELKYSSQTYQTTNTPFVKTGFDSYIFSEHPCDTIFKITNNKIIPLKNIDIGKNGIPFKYRRNIEGLNKMAPVSLIKTGSPMFYRNYLLIRYERNLNYAYFIYHTETEKSQYYKVHNAYDFAFGFPSCSSNGEIIGIVHSTSLNLHKTDPRFELSYKFGDKIPEIEKIRKDVSEIDNPCLIIWNLNEDKL